MKRNGFTLVELLAIIIVIGMLAVITSPYVIKSINTAKDNAFKNSVEGIMRSIQNEIDENEYRETSYTIENGKITNEEGKVLKTAKGDKEKGKAVIDENGRIALAIISGDETKCAIKEKNRNSITITKYEEGKCIIKDPINVAESCFTVNETDPSEITGYTCEEQAIIIPDTINGVEIKTIGYGAFKGENIIAITFSKNITTIGYGAFMNNQLTSIEIPSSVTNILGRAFERNQLTDIAIAESVTSIGAGAFNVNKLPDNQAFIYARNEDGTENRSIIVSYGGAKRENVIIPNNVTNIGERAFYYNQLTSITIPSSVTSIGERAFYDNQLTSITIPSSVTSIGERAFVRNSDNMKVIVNKQEGSISGSPWGASSVEWNG